MLARSGLLGTLGALRSAGVHDLRVLAYHRVLPELDEARFPFDVELVSAVLPEFEWQMAYVARRFRPVSCEQVAAAFDGGPPLPRRAVMVTFDDGFRDNHEVAFPALRRHGVPAVFFLSTGYLDSGAPFWFDRLVQLLLLTWQLPLPLRALGQVLDSARCVGVRRGQAHALLRALKRAPDSTRQSVLQDLSQQASAAGLELEPITAAASAPMRWDQVREMAAAGMEFGSHTVTHPLLSQLDDADRLRDELVLSRQRIEQETGRTVTALAYPVGGPTALNAQVLAATAAAGYRLAFTYTGGANRLAGADRFRLKRLCVERYTTRDQFAAALELPGLFAR